MKQHNEFKLRLSNTTAPLQIESLRVGGTYSPSVAIPPSLLSRFGKSHPQIALRLTTGIKDEIENQVVNSELDVALVSNPYASRFLTTELFCKEPLYAFVSRTHPFAPKGNLTITDLNRIALVVRDGRARHGTTERVLRDLRKRRIQPQIGLRCNSPQAVKEAVRQNLGMGILFKSAVEADIRKGEFKRINLAGLDLIGETYIVYHKDKPLSATAQKFIELLRKEKERSRDRLFHNSRR